jgi:hypothetical protein
VVVFTTVFLICEKLCLQTNEHGKQQLGALRFHHSTESLLAHINSISLFHMSCVIEHELNSSTCKDVSWKFGIRAMPTVSEINSFDHINGCIASLFPLVGWHDAPLVQIPCDQEYFASFKCINITKFQINGPSTFHSNLSPNEHRISPPSLGCYDGYSMIDNNDVCIYFIKEHKYEFRGETHFTLCQKHNTLPYTLLDKDTYKDRLFAHVSSFLQHIQGNLMIMVNCCTLKDENCLVISRGPLQINMVKPSVTYTNKQCLQQQYYFRYLCMYCNEYIACMSDAKDWPKRDSIASDFQNWPKDNSFTYLPYPSTGILCRLLL